MLVTTNDVEEILNKFGNIGPNGTILKVNNLEIYQRAFTHESYINDQPVNETYLPVDSNERLEYLGDQTIKGVLGKYLYFRFPNEREGFLTRLKIKIERCSTLHKMALELNFKSFLLLGTEIESQTILGPEKGRNTPSYHEDAFEAFIGAIVEDAGGDPASKFLINVIENCVDFTELISTNDNFKDSLQKYYQSRRWGTPGYFTIQTDHVPSYRKVFNKCVALTQTQFKELDPKVQKKVVSFDRQVRRDNDQKRNLPKGYIFTFAKCTKVTRAEQKCARQGLITLGIDLNY